MENNYGMLMILLFPLLGGIIGFYLGKKNKETRNDWVDIVMAVELVMLAYLGYVIFSKDVEISLTLSDLLGLGLSLKLDAVRFLLCIAVTVIFGVITQFMKESMKNEAGSNRFYLFYLCMHSMVLGACMTDNLFNFFMFVIFALLFGCPMIMHRQDRQALKSAKVYLFFVVAETVLLLTGVVVVFAYLGSVSYAGMYNSVMSNGGSSPVLIGGLLVFAGFAMFAGVFPVQFQVTRGCSYGLMEISAILSGVVSKTGILGMMLLVSNLFVGSAAYGRILLGFGLVTVVWGLILTLTATDIRKILMGLDVAVNGFNMVSASLMALCGEANGYAVRSSLYLLLVSSLSMTVLYMVALEQVRKVKTYEIKGLIASGKGNVLLFTVCFLACASLAGIPGTMGFLAHSMLLESLLDQVGWKWLTAVYVILWAFFMTAVARILMKLFISRKDETIRILATEEELQKETEEERMSAGQQEKQKNPYQFGEILLLLMGLLQVAVGVLPKLSVDKLGNAVAAFFHSEEITGGIPYFTGSVFIGFIVALVLCIVLYLNLVHGILLRAIRDKKNRHLEESRKNVE
ncbi:MAG: hypothetical protein NC300_07850 [Bacteroidales bacterium]|nr:hypothetical protein [Clostridium sp.]MCM1204043.1 hypothetical protein [Bacteroidales bacterium]